MEMMDNQGGAAVGRPAVMRNVAGGIMGFGDANPLLNRARQNTAPVAPTPPPVLSLNDQRGALHKNPMISDAERISALLAARARESERDQRAILSQGY